jgi:tetratricopeptide (TPR) repeat protein
VGRAAEVDTIVAAASGPAMSVQAIDGMPGVGKTALAIHIGHKVVGELTDLRLFVDLHAHTAGREPVRPTDALADLLTADGADPRYLPADLDGRAALWRARTAGRRVLLILDNAGASDQVVPLLPGAAQGLTLVTSRRRLADLDAVTVSLDTLSVAEAQAMFIRLAPRAAGEGTDVRELVELCGRLPLAIALSAGLFSKRNSWNVRNLIEETAPALLTTRAETRTVAAAFDLSYQSLSPVRQRFLRRLGAHPGVEYDRYAAAVLSDVDTAEAAEHLHGLLDDHLLEEPAYQRFRMHDLVREYARTHAASDPEADRARAFERLLAYYRYTARRAEAQVARYTRCAMPTWDTPPAVPDLTDRGRALTWLRTERANLLACIASATAQGRDQWVVDLTAGVATLLFLDGPWSLAIDLHSNAADLADRLGDTAGQADAHTCLGDIRGLVGQYPASIDHLHRALRLYRDLGDQVGEASALMYLGNVRSLTDGLAATEDLERAYRIYREIGDRRGQAGALLALGIIRRLADDYPGATDDLTHALGIYHDLGDRLGRADVLAHLGVVRREVGDRLGAATDLAEALGIYRDLDHELGQATVFVSLGVLRQLGGDYLDATGCLRRAMSGFRRVGHRFGLANALMSMGTVLRETGDHTGAIDTLRQAVAIYGELGYRQGQAYALTRLGDQLRFMGDRAAAADNIQQALCVFRDLGVPAGEAEALNHRGALRRAEGDLRSALADHQEALRLARAVGSVLEEARALKGIEGETGEREE